VWGRCNQLLITCEVEVRQVGQQDRCTGSLQAIVILCVSFHTRTVSVHTLPLQSLCICAASSKSNILTNSQTHIASKSNNRRTTDIPERYIDRSCVAFRPDSSDYVGQGDSKAHSTGNGSAFPGTLACETVHLQPGNPYPP
jgi:hypothetical protein